MIYECLIAPTESPYSLLEIKRALLTYDKIKIIDPNDRDLMPSTLLYSAIGLPPFMQINGPAVRPLGKTIGYDDFFEKMVAELNPAIKENLVEVISIFNALPIKNNIESISFGLSQRHNYPLNERFIYNLYRELAENIELVSDIVLPSKHELLRNLEISNEMALQGMGDSTYNEGSSLPFINDETLTDSQRGALTRIARARIASMIKCAGFCQKKNIIPIFSGKAYGAILSHVINKSHEVLSEIEDDKLWIRRNRIIELCHEEFIDDDVLNTMSISEVIKLRTVIWGKQAENRENLFSSISEIAIDSTSNDLFRSRSLEILKNYRKESEALTREREKLRFNIKCDLIDAAAIGGPAMAGTMGQLSLGWSMGLTLLGAAPWATKFFKENRAATQEIKARENEIKRSACFGLHNFYSRIKN